MGEPKLVFTTVEAFLDWEAGQDERHELVGGLARMMTGATRRHERISGNVFFALKQRLRSGKCLPFGPDIGVRTAAGNLRRPDVGVDCGAFRDRDVVADQPTLVVEVLSERTRLIDVGAKLIEYMNLPSTRYCLHVEPQSPAVRLARRGEDGTWESVLIEGLDAIVELPMLGITLPLAEIYEGLSFPPE
jgi:Uma2 family endonuclease